MTYHRPTTLTTALNLVAKQGLQVLAGGTDIFPATTAQTLPGPTLDITAIPELRGITQTPLGWRIGAATRWSDIIQAPLPDAFCALQQSAREIGSLQIQNSGTIGGNICNASPAADGVPPLLILDAVVEIASARSTRQTPLADFIKGVRCIDLQPDELVTAILIPAKSVSGISAFQKFGARKYLVISICMTAVRLTLSDTKITSIAISVGSCSPVAQRLTALEAALTGMDITDTPNIRAAIKTLLPAVISPIDDIRADAPSRISAATEQVLRTLQSAERDAR